MRCPLHEIKNSIPTGICPSRVVLVLWLWIKNSSSKYLNSGEEPRLKSSHSGSEACALDLFIIPTPTEVAISVDLQYKPPCVANHQNTQLSPHGSGNLKSLSEKYPRGRTCPSPTWFRFHCFPHRGRESWTMLRTRRINKLTGVRVSVPSHKRAGFPSPPSRTEERSDCLKP